MTLRVRKFSATRYRWEAWRGATLVRSGEATTLESAQKEAANQAATVPGAPVRDEASETAEGEPAAWGPWVRFAGGAALVLVVLWQGYVYQTTGDFRGFVVSLAGLTSVTVLALAARART